MLIYQHFQPAAKSLDFQPPGHICQALSLQCLLGSVFSADISEFFNGSPSAGLEDRCSALWELSTKYPIINENPETTIQTAAVWHGFGNTSKQARESNAKNHDENRA
jgi:hypothetical protein